MIIDFHTHILASGFWPDEWWDHVALEWSKGLPDRRPEHIRGRIEAGLIDPDGSRMIAEMNRSGVDSAVLLVMDWGPDYRSHASVEAVNAHAIAVANRFPGRIIPFAGVDPRRPEAPVLIRSLLDQRAIAGLKLYPACGWDPMDERAQPLYVACAEHGVPVLFHTGDPLPLLDSELGNPVHVAEVAAAHPTLPIILGHSGAPHRWPEALAVAEQHDQVYLELSAWLWANDLSEAGLDDLAKHVLQAKRRVGIERLLFGTDHVSGQRVRGEGAMGLLLDAFEQLPHRLPSGELTGTDMRLVLGGNAASLLSGWLSASYKRG